MSLPKKYSLRKPEQFEGAPDHRFFMLLPNIVDDLPLSPYAFRLYAHLRRVAGERGACWQSSRTLAAQTGMSVGKIVQSKRELAQPFPQLGGLPLITITPQPDGHHLVRLTDVWQQNISAFEKPTPASDGSPGEGGVHPASTTVHLMNARRSPDERKKNPLEEELLEERQRETPARAAARSPATPLPEDFSVSPEMATWATENVPLTNIAVETQQFADYCLEKGVRSKDWPASWRKFMRRALQHGSYGGRLSSAEKSEARLRSRDYKGMGEEVAARIEARRASGRSRFDVDY